MMARKVLLALCFCGLLLCSARAFGQVGKVYPSEGKAYTDEKTGREVVMLTTHPATDDKMYQTHPSWTADGAYIVFKSDRSGSTQLFAFSEKDGTITQLTDGGMNLGTASVGRLRNNIFLMRDSKLVALDIDKVVGGAPESAETVIAEMPVGLVPSSALSQSADGLLLGFMARVDEKDRWVIMTINVKDGSAKTVFESDFKLGHLQFSPAPQTNPTTAGTWIMYCHETGGDADQRTWIINTAERKPIPFYREQPDEWVTHEVWSPDGAGAYFTRWQPVKSVMYVSKADFSSRVLGDGPYWHVGVSRAGDAITCDMMDGRIFHIPATGGDPVLLTAGHRNRNSAHPHPSFSPTGDRVLFNSNRNGSPDLFTVRVKKGSGA